MSDLASLEERDVVLLMGYVTGELDEQAQFEFELRLSTEPQLARAFEAIDGIDGDLRLLAWRGKASRRGRRRIWSLASVAAAALLFWLALPRRAEPTLELRFELTVLPSRATLLEYSVILGLEDEATQTGVGLRSPAGQPSMATREFVDLLRSKEENAARAALTSPTSMIEEERFRVFFEPHQPSWVLILGVTPAGRMFPVLPTEGGLGAVGPFAAGALYALPEPSVELRSDSRGRAFPEYRPDFTLPQGEIRATYIFAVRADAPAPQWGERLNERLLEAGTASTWTQWLRGQGWTVRTFEARERR